VSDARVEENGGRADVSNVLPEVAFARLELEDLVCTSVRLMLKKAA
jgi:hypothetical protein